MGLCEYTTDRDWWETSSSWHQTACRTVPVTSTWPPEAPSLFGLMSADKTTARAGRAAAVLVATRPNVAQAIVATTAANVFMASVPGLEHAGLEHAGLEYARLEYACL